MALKMSQPYKHPKTSVYYFRQHVPTDLRPLLGDKIISWSLRTKDCNEAKLRNAAAVLKQAMIWERHRKQPEPMPHPQIVALSGQFYRSFMATLELEPGEAGIWVEVQKLLDRVATAPNGLEKWYGEDADRLLAEESIVTDEYSRTRLLQELDRALRQVAEQQLKRAEGDYTPDPKASRFPALTKAPAVPHKAAPEGLTIRALFALWERDHLAEGKPVKTVGDFRQKIESLITFVGHDDANNLTPENVADWCEHLRHKEGWAPRTVSQKYLAVVKLVFRLAVEKRKIKDNPTEDLKVRFTKPQRTRSPGFTNAEARVILKAALSDPVQLERWSIENRRAVRWGPWICAFTGARITEVMQLRTEDLLFADIGGTAVPCLRITPDAGSVKTGNYRVVPIHGQLQALGLVRMIQSLPQGPIFFSTEFKKKAADPVTRAKNAGAKVWKWVREVVKITDDRLQPNHAWRHRFKTVARDADIAPEYMDAIQGHEDGRAATDYGEMTMKALWREVQKLPYISLTE